MIQLEEHEQILFNKIDDILQGLSDDNDIHVSGGWVRDKLMGKQSLDIDLVLKKELVDNFCNHLETMLKDNIVVMTPEQFFQYQNNPRKIKDKASLNFVNKSMHIIAQKPLDGIPFHCIICEFRKESSQIVFKIDVRQYYQDDINQDAKARDFTINALYYSLRKKQVIDLVDVLQQGCQRFKKKIDQNCR